MTKTKKTAKKRAAKKKTTKRKTAAPEEYFYLVNGEYIRNLLELAKTLEEISHEAFNHHVKEGHNDFSKWVKNVLKEPKLAKEISLAEENPDKTLVVILKHLLKEKKKR